MAVSGEEPLASRTRMPRVRPSDSCRLVQVLVWNPSSDQGDHAVEIDQLGRTEPACELAEASGREVRSGYLLDRADIQGWTGVTFREGPKQHRGMNPKAVQRVAPFSTGPLALGEFQVAKRSWSHGRSG